MEIQKGTMLTEVHYSEDKQHRYLIYKEWDSSLKKATVIMLNPSLSDAVKMDMTTMYIINNISELGYGSVEIVNIFSKLNEEITCDLMIELLTNEMNDKMILASVARTDITILAWGKAGETNKQVKQRIIQVKELIKEHDNKLYEIGNKRGRKGWHPLSPSVRNGWTLLAVAGSQKEENKIAKVRPKKVEKELD